jgi:ankyrin repeat protein
VLIELGANVNAKDIGGKSIPQLIGTHSSEEGFTPLHGASFFGHAGVVSYLVSHDAAVDMKGPLGLTALLIACVADGLGIVQVLLEKGAGIQ